MSKETGGPAFPELGNIGNNSDWQSESGMTLRDYFAAKAMQGELASGTASVYLESIATRSYAIADAMLRAKGQ